MKVYTVPTSITKTQGRRMFISGHIPTNNNYIMKNIEGLRLSSVCLFRVILVTAEPILTRLLTD